MASTYAFGPFSFDADRLQLQRDGRLVHLQPQPAQVLAALLARAGELVTREELRRAVWPEDTFVDFERGLNFCIAQVRSALGDNAATPVYIRTVPKRGYEFVCRVEVAGAGDHVSLAAAASRRSRRIVILAAAATVVAGAGTWAGIVAARRLHAPIVAVARFDNETGDPAFTRFADTLTDDVVEQLTTGGGGRYRVIGNAAILRVPREQRDLTAVASTLRATYVVLGQVQRAGGRVRVLAHLIRLSDQTHVAVSRTDDVPVPTNGDDLARAIARAFNRHL